ncbi:MAG: exosome complex protein Rrp42 [Nitrososphaerota archaeon]
MSYSAIGERGYAVKITRNRIYELLRQGKRIDGRDPNSFRPITARTGVVEKADGSAIVSLGSTKILTGIKVEVGSPYPDRPNEGTFTVNAELLPLAYKSFEAGPPDERAVELSRVVDRCIRESHAIDLESLVLIKGEKVYMLYIDCYVLDYDGNYFDAAVLSAVAALLTGTMPKYRVVDGKVEKVEGERIPIPVKTIPVSVMMGLIKDVLLVDPIPVEESVLDTSIIVGYTSDSIVAALQKNTPGLMPISALKQAIETGKVKSQELRARLLECLGDAVKR